MGIKVTLCEVLRCSFADTKGCCYVLSPTRKETSYSYQTGDLLNILPTKLNTILSPLLYLLQVTQKKSREFVLPSRSPRQQ